MLSISVGLSTNDKNLFKFNNYLDMCCLYVIWQVFNSCNKGLLKNYVLFSLLYTFETILKILCRLVKWTISELCESFWFYLLIEIPFAKSFLSLIWKFCNCFYMIILFSSYYACRNLSWGVGIERQKEKKRDLDILGVDDGLASSAALFNCLFDNFYA